MSLTPKQNALAVLHGEQPDYYGDFMFTFNFIPHPVQKLDACPKDGEIHYDSWGVAYQFLTTAAGPHPMVTPENAVIKDITKWEEQLKVPSLKGLDFSEAKALADAADRNDKFVGFMFSAGLFERSHHLQGISTALLNYRRHPEEMKGLLRAICEYKKEYINLCAKEFNPEIIFYHDDWGAKYNMFLNPKVWREMIKPLQMEISKTIHDNNIIYVHHSDCFCQPIVEDMVDIGVDLWQGTIPQNDIVEIQRITNGKLPMIGGIDGPKIDVENTTEEEIRAEVRRAFDTYIPGGPFFPAIANGCCLRKWNNEIYMDELNKYGYQYAKEHPVK